MEQGRSLVARRKNFCKLWYKSKAKSGVKLQEKSDEVIVPKMIKTTKLDLGKDLYFNQAEARR